MTASQRFEDMTGEGISFANPEMMAEATFRVLCQILEKLEEFQAASSPPSSDGSSETSDSSKS